MKNRDEESDISSDDSKIVAPEKYILESVAKSAAQREKKAKQDININSVRLQGWMSHSEVRNIGRTNNFVKFYQK